MKTSSFPKSFRDTLVIPLIDIRDACCYLIKCVLDNYKHRGVCGTQFSVEGLEAGAMTGRAVSQLPGVADGPGGKLLT